MAPRALTGCMKWIAASREQPAHQRDLGQRGAVEMPRRRRPTPRAARAAPGCTSRHRGRRPGSLRRSRARRRRSSPGAGRCSGSVGRSRATRSSTEGSGARARTAAARADDGGADTGFRHRAVLLGKEATPARMRGATGDGIRMSGARSETLAAAAQTMRARTSHRANRSANIGVSLKDPAPRGGPALTEKDALRRCCAPGHDGALGTCDCVSSRPSHR